MDDLNADSAMLEKKVYLYTITECGKTCNNITTV